MRNISAQRRRGLNGQSLKSVGCEAQEEGGSPVDCDFPPSSLALWCSDGLPQLLPLPPLVRPPWPRSISLFLSADNTTCLISLSRGRSPSLIQSYSCRPVFPHLAVSLVRSAEIHSQSPTVSWRLAEKMMNLPLPFPARRCTPQNVLVAAVGTTAFGPRC